jgi:hypothetical protein
VFVRQQISAKARGPFLTSTLGANFDPQGRSCPPGVNFVPWGWNSLFAPPFF